MSNVEIIRELYQAFATDRLDRVLELCDPDCVVTQDPALPWGGRHEGLDGVATFGALLGGTVHSVVASDELFEAGDRVIQYGRSRGTVLSSGVTFDNPEVHIWTLRDGKVVAAEFYVDTAAMLRRARAGVVKAGTYAEARIDVHASPASLYDLVSDVHRMGEWSPECRRCEWIDGATEPAVGARFKGTNKRGAARWSTKPRVVVADAGREFAFVTGHLGRDMTRWSYRFEPIADHASVTESFEILSDMPWYFRLADRLLMGVKDRKSDLETNMGETLRRLKAAAESADDRTRTP